MKQAVILAGGKGTRLRERLDGRPKPLIDIGGQPLLEHQILLLKRYGFTHVLILVNHAADQIVDFCATNANWGLDITCVDDGKPRGTAGATLAAFDDLAETFLVMYGDTMLDVHLDLFFEAHKAAGAHATLLVHPNDHPHDSDLVELDERSRVVAFHPYPHDASRYFRNLVNAALYWIEKSALILWRSEQTQLDFGRDLFPAMLREGAFLYGYECPEYIKDAGTPGRLDKVSADLESGRIERSRLSTPQAMIFLDRDGTLIHDVNHLNSPDQLRLLPGVEEALRRVNKSEYRCCVVTNQPVIARGECGFEGLQQIHAKLETLLGESGAYLERIYYCPHHPDAGFAGERPELKIACDCRKPNTAMIDQAQEDFNVALEQSWLIGDTSVDVETARRAGIRSMLVETGHGGLDYRFWNTPDYSAASVRDAIDFILDEYPEMVKQCRAKVADVGDGDVVLIGGQSRSGKSTLASLIRDALHTHGRTAQILCLDRWLKSEADREAGVAGRYDLDEFGAVLQRLLRGREGAQQVALPGYHKLERRRVERAESTTIFPKDVIIVEGTLALALSAPESVTVHRFYLDIDEAHRRERFVREYRRRGYSEQAALKLYNSRLQDEFDVVLATQASARSITGLGRAA